MDTTSADVPGINRRTLVADLSLSSDGTILGNYLETPLAASHVPSFGPESKHIAIVTLAEDLGDHYIECQSGNDARPEIEVHGEATSARLSRRRSDSYDAALHSASAASIDAGSNSESLM